jgi:hypothetical protein
MLRHRRTITNKIYAYDGINDWVEALDCTKRQFVKHLKQNGCTSPIGVDDVITKVKEFNEVKSWKRQLRIFEINPVLKMNGKYNTKLMSGYEYHVNNSSWSKPEDLSSGKNWVIDYFSEKSSTHTIFSMRFWWMNDERTCLTLTLIPSNLFESNIIIDSWDVISSWISNKNAFEKIQLTKKIEVPKIDFGDDIGLFATTL